MTEPQQNTGWAWARDRYGLDPRSLAAFRIAMAGLILFDLALRFRQLREFYAADGMMAPYVFEQTLSRTFFWPHFWNGSLEFQGLLFALAATFALAMLFGYRTRIATLLSWFLLTSLHFRNPAILTFGDTIFRLLLFWSIFLPLGELWSADRRRRDRQAERAATDSVEVRNLISVGAIAIQLQIVFLYLFSALYKVGPEWTVDGSAVYYALSVDYNVYPLGFWLLQYPELMKFLSFSTLYFEAIGPLLFFFPFYSQKVRLGTAIAFVLMHAGMATAMRFGFFQLVPCAAMLLFVPAFVWDRWGRS